MKLPDSFQNPCCSNFLLIRISVSKCRSIITNQSSFGKYSRKIHDLLKIFFNYFLCIFLIVYNSACPNVVSEVWCSRVVCNKEPKEYCDTEMGCNRWTNKSLNNCSFVSQSHLIIEGWILHVQVCQILCFIHFSMSFVQHFIMEHCTIYIENM